MGDVLPDGGEMREAIALFEWSQTPLGDSECWTPALRMMVGFLVASGFPMLLWWGPDYVSIYNDAYRPILGTKHPWALGRPVSEVWEEIWPVLQPLIDTPFHGGPATWNDDILLEINRAGFLEETHFTIAYSAVPDEAASGGIGGVLATVHEITGKVVADRRVAVLRDLATHAVDAKTASEACAIAATTLGRHPSDIPFALLYLVSADRQEAQLVATAGVEFDEASVPARVSLQSRESAGVPWPFVEALLSAQPQTVTGLAERFGGRVPAGPWADPPDTAVVFPIPSRQPHQPVAFLVAGISSRLALDDGYLDFLNLVSSQIATGVANASEHEEERRRAQALAELDRAKSAFFSNVSHEFRTPLTLMLAPLHDALGDGEALDRDQVELVHRNGLRLLKLVNGLLDFSRIEAGRLRATFRPVDVAGLTADLVGTFADACRRAGLELTMHADALPGEVYLDPDLWERVVLNLVSNAFKVTMTGGIAVDLRPDAAGFSLAVSDTGPGLAPEEQARVFERFYRVKTAQARSYEGAGIGLALVKELVELHGGQIALESAVGAGATFTVTVPFGRDHLPPEQVSDEPIATAPGIADLFADEAMSWLSADGPEEAGPGNAAPPTGARPGRGRVDTSGARVLIADDNPDLRRYLTRLLSPYWVVEAVANGADALRLARELLPDLLVTDVVMPELDGFELLAELRAAPATRELPVIMLSARAGEEASIEGLEAGADDYLPKPFSGRELLARVRAHLELSLVRRQASEEIRGQRVLLEQTLTQLPAGVIMAEAPSGRIVLANQQVEEILGHDLIEADSIEDYPAYHGFGPDGQPMSVAQSPMARAIRDGEVVHDEEVRYQTGRGPWITLRVSAAPIVNASGRTVAGVVVFQDISERVRGERLLASQRDVMAMIARGEPLVDTLSEIVRAYERLSDRGGRASILLTSADGTHLELGSDIVSDTQHDPPWVNFRELAAEHGLAPPWSTPVFATDGELVGTFAIYHREPTEPSPEEREVVELLARTAARGDRARPRRPRPGASAQRTADQPPSAPAARGRGGGGRRHVPSR